MKKLYGWFHRLPKRMQDSLVFSITMIGFISTLFTVFGFSLKEIPDTNIGIRIGMVIAVAVIFAAGYYWILGMIYKDSISLIVAQTEVDICCGDIFKTEGLKIIGCDNRFDTRIDDTVISKRSLHGKLVLEHGDTNEIREVVQSAAEKSGLKKDKDGLYRFPLGTVIKYESKVDGQTYLLLAATELNKQYEAHTNMADFERMLMKMWKEIDRVYASQDIALPILGSGILRFDDGFQSKEMLLRCILCTFNSSGVRFNSKLKIVIYGNTDEIQLYEYKNIFNIISRR